MGIAERKEREREEMQQLILDTAHKLFLENGFEKTSIRAIADGIEYSPATIYLYFRDKNEIFLALHQRAFEKLKTAFQPVLQIRDPFAQLVELGHVYLDWGIANPGLYELCFLMEAPMDALACRDEAWKEGQTSFGMLREVLAGCMEAGYFGRHDLDTMALTVWSYIHGLVAIYLRKRMNVFEDDRDIERMRESYTLYVKMLRNGL